MPRMQSTVCGFTPDCDVMCCALEGAVADVWSVNCAQFASGRYVSEQPRLFVVLEQTPGSCFHLHNPSTGATARHASSGCMSYVPAEVVLEGRAEGLHHIKHLDLHFSEAMLQRRFGRALDGRRLRTPRMGLTDERIFALASLLAQECESSGRHPPCYGNALVTAICSLLFEVSAVDAPARTSLTARQLRLAQDYIEAHCFEKLRLSDIAARVNLSPSHFSHAFKSAAGVPPLQWLMERRVRKVQDIIRDGCRPLTEIASLAGFSDQAHLTRVFKRHVGATPSEWRRSQGAEVD